MKGLISLLKSKSFISLLGNGVSALLGLLSFALLARYTSKQEFGIWIIFLTIYGIFDTLRTGMVLNAFIKNYTQAVDNKERHQVIGSSWQLSIYVNFAYAVIIAFIYAIFFFYNILPNYHSFFFWLLIISIFSLPFNFATWLLNAELHIFQMSLARIYNQMLFIVLAIVLLFYFSFDKIVSILIAYSLAQLLTTIICIIKGWTGIQYYKNRTKAGLQDLFQFGKFSMGTLVGSNLLKGSDSFLIGKFLGTVAVATYNVPSRVVDVFDLVIRSFAITNMPALSSIYASGNMVLLKKEFERKTGFLFLLLFPLSIISFVFAEPIVIVLAGNQYKDAALLLKLFSIYTALTPIDKLSGVMLDIINKPRLNFIKVILMLSVNVIGDIVCLYLSGTLESVAIVSTFTFATGVVYGMYLLNKHIEVSFLNVFKLGFQEFVFKFKTITHNNI
jgi:O-antigen/teichoic acid export membrane protein